jgi:hypothetical protein
MILFSSCYVKPVKVEAAATTVAVAGAVTVAVAIAALGIGVSGAMNTPAYNKACQNIWNGMTSAVQKSAVWVSGAAGQIHANLSSAFLHAVVGGMVTAYPPADVFSHVTDFTSLCDALGFDANLSSSWNYGWKSQLTYSDLNNWKLLQKGTITAGVSISVGGLLLTVSQRGNVGFQNYNSFVESNYYSNFNNSFQAYIGTGYPYAILAAQASNGLWENFWLVAASGYPGICVYPKTGTGVAPVISAPDVYIPALESLFAQGYSVMNHKVDDVISRVGALQGTQAGITAYLGDYAGTLAQINDAIKALTQAQVTSVDATDAAERTANDTVNKGRDTTAPKNPTMPDMTIPRMITRKFPFSIPWDLYNSVTILASPGEAPKWVFPFGSNSISVDMSPYNGVAAVARWGISLLFLIALIILTSRVIKH